MTECIALQRRDVKWSLGMVGQLLDDAAKISRAASDTLFEHDLVVQRARSRGEVAYHGNLALNTVKMVETRGSMRRWRMSAPWPRNRPAPIDQSDQIEHTNDISSQNVHSTASPFHEQEFKDQKFER